MSKNQIVIWKAIILLSLTVGVAFSALWLLSGNPRGVLIGVVLLVFGAGLAIILRRATRATED